MYDPQPGDIGLTQIEGDVGRLIRLGQYLNGGGFADYEHAFVYLGNGQIIEAEPGGARIAELTEYDQRTLAWLKCPPQYRDAVAEAARSQVGTPYSFADYLAIALHRFHVPAPGLRKFIASGKHAMCSALADRIAALGGWHWYDDGRWEGYVTPADVWRLIQAQNAATTPPPVPHRPIVPGMGV
ncbi:MAG TPA: hypothetical protein VIN75_05730 [Burkholderiaceae bacterium]